MSDATLVKGFFCTVVLKCPLISTPGMHGRVLLMGAWLCVVCVGGRGVGTGALNTTANGLLVYIGCGAAGVPALLAAAGLRPRRGAITGRGSRVAGASPAGDKRVVTRGFKVRRAQLQKGEPR
jgi:hypothetical protein